MATDKAISFCTLGMFILDDIYPRKTDTDQSPKLNVIGGAGTYSAVGARLFAKDPGSIGWIVDAGTDFPGDVLRTITSWDTGLILRQRDGLTTRGWNAYTEGDTRDFRYLTEKKRIVAEDLPAAFLVAASFHLICSAERCKTLVQDILQKRPDGLSRPLMIWEPVPDLCVAAEFDKIKAALLEVDVFSPNHEELAAMFDKQSNNGDEPAVKPDVLDKATVEQQVKELLDAGIGKDGKGFIVVRSGREGAFAATRTEKFWLPAYHKEQTTVVDPTGGGNGFLGGLAMGLAQKASLQHAVAMASISASFCIEQVGPPTLDQHTEDHAETWNGVDVLERLRQYNART